MVKGLVVVELRPVCFAGAANCENKLQSTYDFIWKRFRFAVSAVLFHFPFLCALFVRRIRFLLLQKVKTGRNARNDPGVRVSPG